MSVRELFPCFRFDWSAHLGLNQGLFPYEGTTLTTELWAGSYGIMLPNRVRPIHYFFACEDMIFRFCFSSNSFFNSIIFSNSFHEKRRLDDGIVPARMKNISATCVDFARNPFFKDSFLHFVEQEMVSWFFSLIRALRYSNANDVSQTGHLMATIFFVEFD